ncbi:MAG: bifunctional pyr operon transcriptional regulator/uracil phosphoribosyltransferase PyrR [Elusimicrobiota bacterium]|jgi:pyrimidine operon attenuation protein/uracil phosphoribosyltransferase|nr:bifunctional pyr operon transcriptional regulator/uracil phosphoribosyltransferase PyrR [Elusimicrobiota bacterium]
MTETILDAKGFEEAVKRIVNEIYKSSDKPETFVIIGIHSNGVFIAKRILKELELLAGIKIPFGTLDITLYRDDIDNLGASSHEIKDTSIPFDIDISQKNIILVDDVLYTGRTIRAALDVLMSFGRPQSIKLAAFVDRGNRELPIEPNFVGIKYQSDTKIKVECKETGKEDRVFVLK